MTQDLTECAKRLYTHLQTLMPGSCSLNVGKGKNKLHVYITGKWTLEKIEMWEDVPVDWHIHKKPANAL